MIITLEKLKDRFRSIRELSDFNHFEYELNLEDFNSSPLTIEILSLIGRNHKKDTLPLSIILANLLMNYSSGGIYTAFTWDGKKIVSSVNGFGVSQNRIKELMTFLIHHGFSEQHKGGRDKSSGHQWRSKIRASIKLTDLARSYYPDGLTLSKPENRNPIRMRDKAPIENSKGTLIDYKDIRIVRDMRKRLIRYNKLMSQSQITLDEAKADRGVINSTDFNKTFTYRVFNEGKWSRGGRFTGGWCLDIPSKQRKHILINGSPTVEIDFKNQHLVLLYALEGIHYGDLGSDGYEVLDRFGNPYMRHVVKKLFTIALNCPSAKRTIRSFIGKRLKKEKAAKENGNPFSSFPLMDRADLKRVLEGFMSHHSTVAHHIFESEPIGLYLQFLDSQIADEVLRLMTRAKIPVLCVHDSFICAVQHEDLLIKVMAQAYARVLREQLGFESDGVLRLVRSFLGEDALLTISLRDAV